tara:strand:- start:205 stop:1371 length:1167 start_codon:yes stop_codon:yes gene_type:complete
MSNYLVLLEYAETETQIDTVQACIDAKSNRQAAVDLGIDLRGLQRTIKRVERNAAKRGYSPDHDMNKSAPEGYIVKGTSTLYDDEGNTKIQWVKTSNEGRVAENLANILEDYKYKPAPKVPKPTSKQNSDLATLYTITDFHLGMYAYKQETGDDWDTKIAAKVMVNAIKDMVHKSPDSELGILNIQGDFLHWDGLDAVTPASGHILDADTRFDRMIELAIDLNAWAIEELLAKHKNVRVIICEGNHDLAGSAWLRKTIKKLMSDNPRVTVDDTAMPYYAYLHGEIMLGFHHGHKKANKALPLLFSSEPRYRAMWGAATYAYIHTGHYHHKEVDSHENGGAIVERHQTLSGRDAYAARGGFISQRGAVAITYHKIMGEVERVRVLPRDE